MTDKLGSSSRSALASARAIRAARGVTGGWFEKAPKRARIRFAFGQSRNRIRENPPPRKWNDLGWAEHPEVIEFEPALLLTLNGRCTPARTRIANRAAEYRESAELCRS